MSPTKQSWFDALLSLKHPRVLTMLFFGFSAGIPLLLIFSSLSLWLREAGVERSAVTYFSWAALAYSFKFLWAPLVDRLPIFFLTRRFGRRRAWLLVSQFAVICSILSISMIDPSQDSALTWMALAAVMLGFSSATQDIVIDAYRIESAGEDMQALMSSTYIAGYRIGMLVSGAGALLIASTFGSSPDNYVYEAWRYAYALMALTMLVGVFTTLLVSEPESLGSTKNDYTAQQYLRFLGLFGLGVCVFVLAYVLSTDLAQSLKVSMSESLGNKALAGFLVELLRLIFGFVLVVLTLKLCSRTSLYEHDLINDSYVEPVKEFFQRYGLKLALFVLIFVGFYRVSDIVLGVIANVFFQDMGFTKTEIATVVKSFGLFMTIAGGFLGGILSVRFGVVPMLYLGALLTVITNLLFVLLAKAGADITMLYLVISADNLTAGLASAAFIAFLSGLTNRSFTAVQYAIFSSLMTLFPKIIGGYSGSMVDNIGYENFFLLASAMGLPVLLLIYWVQKQPRFQSKGASS